MKRFARPLSVATVALATLAFTALPARGGDVVDVAAKAGSFKTLIAAAKAADLVPALKGDGPITVFAPTDGAFDKLPDGTVETLLKPENKGMLQAILKFHVVAGDLSAAEVANRRSLTTLGDQRLDVSFAGGKLTVNGAGVAMANVKADNGTIHVIDTVMMPEGNDIVDTAVAAEFETLVAAVKAAGLVEALKGEGPFTVFAPTDAAFGKLPKGMLKSLLKPENKKKLQSILTYHVVPGRVYAGDAAGGATVKTLQGETVTTKLEGGQLMVNGVKVVATDIETSNGVIHVIDSVIMPKGGQAAAKRMIETAVAVGAPAFNQGHVGRCVAVYDATLAKLTDHDGLNAKMRSTVAEELKAARHEDNDRRRAWMHRHTLDKVYASMGRDVAAQDEMADLR